jgi:riboflavin kinase/FMN adenylyltransferase
VNITPRRCFFPDIPPLMQHYDSFKDVNIKSAWVTIGSFDGVHLGHKTLVRLLVSKAHQDGSPAVVVTFFPHPSALLRGNLGPFYLTSPEERAELLGQLGVDGVITLAFTRELADLSADQFMDKLRISLGLKCFLAGSNFALGSNRAGNLTVLREIGQQKGYSIYEIPPINIDGEMVSSSKIRQLLNLGEVEQASLLLDRRYNLSGIVVPGDHRGRLLGYPTANLQIWAERLLPANGIYATRVIFQKRVLMGATNIGIRPTFESEAGIPRVETYILDFNGDLYGKKIELEFVKYLRPEVHYSSVEELLNQIEKDTAQTREVLSYVI